MKIKPQLKSLSVFYNPKTQNQKQYVKLLNEPKTNILFAIGPAGTGKTALACNNAISQFKGGNYEKIIITRPIVTVEEELGFLPGNINKKMDPWTRPIFDIFQEFYSKKDIDIMVQNNVIEIAPLAYMRGRTFKNSFIIADEMQNSSPNQMLMLLTRIGVNSKMVVTGDLQQTDKNTGQLKNGLEDFIQKYKRFHGYNIVDESIQMVELNATDIERHPVITKLLDIYDDKPKSKEPNVKKRDLVQYRNDAALIPIEHQTKFMDW